MPARITWLGTPGGSPRPVFSSGFKVEKHNDGKSVRLFHVTADIRAGAIGRGARQALRRSQMRSLEAYDKALDRDGFTRIEAEGGDRPARFSLWRRADEAASARASVVYEKG